MSSPDPPSTEPTMAQREHMTDSYHSFIHNTSLTMLFLAPILIAIPPRKIDLYTFTLGGAFIASANQLTKERTGAGLVGQFRFGELPPQAREAQARMRAEKEERERRGRLLEEPLAKGPKQGTLLEQKAKEIWMGGETEGWKEKRLKEEQEKIEQGEGYGSMIMDQIWEVWNWGEKKGEELKEKDERVMEERRSGREFPQVGKEVR